MRCSSNLRIPQCGVLFLHYRIRVSKAPLGHNRYSSHYRKLSRKARAVKGTGMEESMRWKERLQQLLQGRYGMDGFGNFLLWMALLYSGAVCAVAYSGAALSWRSADGLSVFSGLFKKCAETLSGKLYILSLCK